MFVFGVGVRWCFKRRWIESFIECWRQFRFQRIHFGTGSQIPDTRYQARSHPSVLEPLQPKWLRSEPNSPYHTPANASAFQNALALARSHQSVFDSLQPKWLRSGPDSPFHTPANASALHNALALARSHQSVLDSLQPKWASWDQNRHFTTVNLESSDF